MTPEQLDTVIKRIQRAIPIVEQPFKALADDLEMSEQEVIEAVARLKFEKKMRRLSLIFDTRSLGYDSSLVAFRIPEERIAEAGALVSEHPGVSHNYKRTHDFNLWFTLAIPPDSRLGMEDTVNTLARLTQPEDFAILRSIRTFKIGVKLDPRGAGTSRETVKQLQHNTLELSLADKMIVRTCQADWPMISRPFHLFAEQLRMDPVRLIEQLQQWEKLGAIRRAAGIMFHRKVGFRANGMVVWRIPEERMDEVGPMIASYRAVSHCYERSTAPGWTYNLFAMTHGKTPEDVQQVVDEIKAETGLDDCVTLYSTHEFKKKRIDYFSPALHSWEEKQR